MLRSPFHHSVPRAHLCKPRSSSRRPRVSAPRSLSSMTILQYVQPDDYHQEAPKNHRFNDSNPHNGPVSSSYVLTTTWSCWSPKCCSRELGLDCLGVKCRENQSTNYRFCGWLIDVAVVDGSFSNHVGTNFKVWSLRFRRVRDLQRLRSHWT